METLAQLFKDKYINDEMRVVQSPLRIFPIGAHSDYQGGRVTGMTLPV